MLNERGFTITYCKCFFCGDSRFRLNIDTGLPGKESVIYEDNYVYITPDIAPLVCGHFLIITKEHLNSFGNADDEIFESLMRAKDFIKTNPLCDTEVLFFEHGAVIEHSAGSCIDHAHMHCIPIIPGVSVDEYIKKCGFIDSEKLKATKYSLSECIKRNQPYIYYDSASEGEWLYHVNYLPTQFFRMMISQKLSTQHNWKITFRQNDSKELFVKTLELVERNKGENKRLCNIGKKNIYNQTPYLCEIHDDDVEFDARTHNRVLSTASCPEPGVCALSVAD